ncbi:MULTISPECIES: PRD domain-containing protein [Vagococcus]|uniref:Mannitol operon activator, BglG family n=1 Tax=Vagococcus fluvialis bH819 TaxID=1255619 RepID=A0A1X6WKG5_9ENTE|nr:MULTISPECIES: PRD domain-containing protein [Vagococcus]SLM84739.1 Mannitol operon activator, BglG family [Vagococcus fluvialis bH819]HCM89799.1 PRD domain-containing protein [Vagococcus sp.]
MFLTPREKILLTELLNSPASVSINQMLTLLKVSRRMVYRELDSLTQSLASIDVDVKKISRGNYQLIYEKEQKKELEALLGTTTQMELSTIERQRSILLEFLDTTEVIPMIQFLEKYQISNTTFYADIKQLEEQIKQSPLKIVRNQGYEITGSEKYRRLLMANVLETEINEYQFFNYDPKNNENPYFFSYISSPDFFSTKKMVLEELNQSLPNLSDRKRQHLILVAFLSVKRVKAGHVLFEDTYTERLNKNMLNISKRIFAKLGKETQQLYPVNEIVFYSSLLNDFSNSFDENFFEENFDTELAYDVKTLIELVSEETEIDFFEDYNLYKMLLTHLSGVFSRAILKEDTLTNPILERIMEQYQELANGIRQSLPIAFEGQVLTEEEIAYMVLHFANSLERSPKIIEVDVAGFSPSGLVSTSMLEMKLRHHFPFIHQIHFYSIAELDKIKLEEDYDLVVSTSVLPGYQGHYELVTPLLLEDEVKRLKDVLKKIDKRDRKPRVAIKNLDEGKAYTEVLKFMDDVNELLSHFFVKKISYSGELEELLQALLSNLDQELVSNQEQIYQKLLKRLKQSPVAIPKTSMALFHASTEGIKKPIFCIMDLEEEMTLMGMDKVEMKVSRILLMLSPQEVTGIETKLLSKISGAIIMNDLYTEIFNSGNESIMYQLLSTLLIEEMKH